MSAWLKRFGLHLAAAVGATGIFVAATAVGASQTRQQVAVVATVTAGTPTPSPAAQRRPPVSVLATPAPAAEVPPATQPAADPGGQAALSPTVVPQALDTPPSRPGPLPPASQSTRPPGQAQATPGPASATSRTPPSPTPGAAAVVPERSLAGTIKAVLPDGLDVMGVGGREWHVVPAPGALIRLNGKAVRLDTLQAGDTVVILGQAQGGSAPSRFVAHAITTRRK